MLATERPSVDSCLVAGRRESGATSPRAAASRLELAPRLQGGRWDRFSGYAVDGTAFISGHLLALRRFPATSVGPASTSVWHRNPDRRWTLYADVPSDPSRVRYFGGRGAHGVRAEVTLAWHRSTSFTVRVREARLAWAVHLTSTPVTRALNAIPRFLPMLWRTQAVRRAAAVTAGRLLGLGPLRLAGRTSGGHRFLIEPHGLWLVSASVARIGDEHLGPPVELREQPAVGDLRIPHRGIFTIGSAQFEPAPRVEP